MKIAIVDDESLYLNEIEKRITAVCDKYNIDYRIERFNSPTLIAESNRFSKFDVVFMDIDMPNINGIELAKRINRTRQVETKPFIVFISAMDNMVFEALNQFPYSFVRKSHLKDLDQCVLNIHKKVKDSPAYALKIGKKTKFIHLSKIIYLEKQGNYVDIFTTEDVFRERSLIDEKFQDLARFNFLRPHVGAIVNPEHITEINNDYLRLSNGKEIWISRTYKKDTRAKYWEWLVRTK